MSFHVIRVLVVSLALTGCGAAGTAQSAAGQLPPLVRFSTPQAVVDEHVDALNKCDFTRLMAQYPNDVEFFLPAGQVIKGREGVAELFRGFVKPVSEGGLCGLTFTVEHQQVVGDTINAAWRATAPFLLEDYLGSDAYVTKDGLMQAQVTTFEGERIKFKK